MKVKDLIKLLAKFDPEYRVLTFNGVDTDALEAGDVRLPEEDESNELGLDIVLVG